MNRPGAVAALVVVSCAGASRHSRPAAPVAPQTLFWTNLAALCGQAFDGTITSNQGGDAPDPFEGKRLRMHVQPCADASVREIRIAFHVGDDRSRTWVVTR